MTAFLTPTLPPPSPRPLSTRVTLTCTQTPSKPSTSEPSAKTARRSLDNIDIPSFSSTIAEKAQTPVLTRRTPTTLQINIGLTCNLACRHCHVESSPSRTETMSPTVSERLLHLAANTPSLHTVDLTGGAPELHQQFRPLVTSFRDLGLQVIDRCNLIVIEEQPDLVEFLANHRVKVVASMPCYSVENVRKQRGDGVFDASINALKKLNAAGYGRESSGLELDLVYNPVGPNLPPPAKELEADYKRVLWQEFNIEFNRLFCITNMPIKRFADDLLISGRMVDYMQLLLSSFNPSTVDNVMCRDQIHVAHDGRFYDCDFNYALDMTLPVTRSSPLPMPYGLSIFDINSFSELQTIPIRTGKHCYGCTAGTGSSCGGSLS